MDRRHLLALGALAAIWGASFLLIEIALRDLAPSTLIAFRLGSAALVLLPFALRRREEMAMLRGRQGSLALMGLLNAALPFFLISWGQQYIDSGVAAILNASAPLWTALLALAYVRSERVSGLRLAGFVAGFGGVVLVVGSLPREGDARTVLGSLAVVAAAACFAVGALYTARRLTALPAVAVSFGTLAWGTLFTLPAGLLQLGGPVGWEAVSAGLALGVGATAVGYLLYFGLIAGAGASRAILVTYLVPSVALVYGVTLLDEPLTAYAVGGLALVLAGVAFGAGALRPGRRAAAPVAG